MSYVDVMMTISPLERLGRWVATNAGLPDTLDHDDAEQLIAALGASTVGGAIADVAAADAGVRCLDCGELVVPDPDDSDGVWVHDRELGDLAYDLDSEHAARPPEEDA